MADRLIPSACREGRILDIGCGCYPLFLLHTEFNEKVGMDKVLQPHEIGEWFNIGRIKIVNYDSVAANQLPFGDANFDVVTMLAVLEHLSCVDADKLAREIYRVLKPGGRYILTTPAFWTGRLLKIMADLRLASPVEIADHKKEYRMPEIKEILAKAGFRQENIKSGCFEFGCNTWAAAVK
jgi:ubiquinone/menaquinone biosynthesis C-methylase UbiE